jgi:hypothetical protein
MWISKTERGIKELPSIASTKTSTLSKVSRIKGGDGVGANTDGADADDLLSHFCVDLYVMLGREEKK